MPDRIEFDLILAGTAISANRARLEVDVAGRFLYGAPAADLDLDGDMTIAAADERAGFAGYQFGLADEDRSKPLQQSLDDLPSTDASATRTSRSLSTSRRRPPIRCKRRSPCAWPNPAAAPSSAS